MTARRVRLQYVSDCPLVERVRADLRLVLAATGISAVLEEDEGDYPSPTLLVDGRDVVTGRSSGDAPQCRLDLPTREQIATALSRGTR